MKIAQISPLYESVPPKLYGGTERVVHWLTEELVHQGHDVTLFASGDSETSAKLDPQCKQALRLDDSAKDHLAAHVLMMEHVFQRACEFDVLHFHTDYLHFSGARRLSTPSVTTMHGRQDISELAIMYREFNELPLVSISNNQRQPVSFANWIATAYHGMPTNLFEANVQPGKYLLFLGRFSPEKRADRAIELAKRLDMDLILAGKVDRNDRNYFDSQIKPLLNHPKINFIGEVGQDQQNELIGNAAALVFMIDWPEPFGLVMIEAMACGTPVIATNCGSVPEVITDGLTGIICDNLDEAENRFGEILNISRSNCRLAFEADFAVERMADDYLEIYKNLVHPQLQIAQSETTADQVLPFGRKLTERQLKFARLPGG